MVKNRRKIINLFIINLSATLIGLCLVNIVYSSEIFANPTNFRSNSLKFTPPPPPPDRSAAGNRGGAASRGCNNGEQPLMALAPDYQQTITFDREEIIPVTKVWGLTTAEYPTFWFFVPYDQSSIATIEFVIKDESQTPSKTLYRNFLNKPETPGVVSIPMNKSIQALEISEKMHHKMYHWFLKVRVKCDPEQPAKLETIDGWIERIELSPNLTEKLKQGTLLQQIELYAENGIWYDALMNLAKLRLAKPQDTSLQEKWTNLLLSEELENLADRPLLNCCKAD
ncbi:DUF928 domain-containing protein [Mastigocoleus testarum]|uniref:DUF928 domain-containing protein n=1 Tax=Mastigocoleus testarum BC008 TaxID=371196 RepID=A0A0V7ZM79_9CYAN|nr:DUF928 domain-containing protein [Mastigocoleus testarum]KST65673.1 hypothetical protein BC008_22090 [Mastigocoleus testarum BC008]